MKKVIFILLSILIAHVCFGNQLGSLGTSMGSSHNVSTSSTIDEIIYPLPFCNFDDSAGWITEGSSTVPNPWKNSGTYPVDLEVNPDFNVGFIEDSHPYMYVYSYNLLGIIASYYEKLISPEFSLNDLYHAILEFDAFFEWSPDQGDDGSGVVEICYDGMNWIPIHGWYNEDFEGHVSLDITPYVGHDQVRIRFCFNAPHQAAQVFAIDNVVITGDTEDTYGPSIYYHNIPEIVYPGTDASISLTAWDPNGVGEITLHYQEWDSVNEVPLENGIQGNTTFSQDVGDTLSAAIPATDGWEHGMDVCWHIIAEDQSDPPQSSRYPNENNSYYFYEVRNDTVKPEIIEIHYPYWAFLNETQSFNVEVNDRSGISEVVVHYVEWDTSNGGAEVPSGITGTLTLNGSDGFYSENLDLSEEIERFDYVAFYFEISDGWNPANIRRFPENPDSILYFQYLDPPDYYEDFENESQYWESCDENVWDWGEVQDLEIESPAYTTSGNHFWATNRYGYYADNTIGTLSLDKEFVPDNGAKVQCMVWYTFYYADGFQLQVSSDNGLTWEVLEPLGGYPYESINGLQGTPGYSGFCHEFNNRWIFQSFPLDDYVNEIVIFRFKMGSIYFPHLECFGGAIDDFFVTGCNCGSVEGNIYVDENETPAENANVYLYQNNILKQEMLSDENGYYRFDNLYGSQIKVGAWTDGYSPAEQDNITVEDEQIVSVDLILSSPQQIDFSGSVNSLDRENIQVPNATIAIPDLGIETTSDINGNFSFTGVLEGQYDIEVYFTEENFDGSFHNHQILSDVMIHGLMESLDLYIFEVLAPTNLIATPGDAAVALSWQAPENHINLDDAEALLNSRYEVLNRLPDKSDTKLEEFKSKLCFEINRLERRVQNDNTTQLDDLGSFIGYRISVDGDVVENLLVNDLMCEVIGISNHEEHLLRVAADYGYGEEFLMFSNPVEVIPMGDYVIELDNPFEWIEIRPDFGGDGTACNANSFYNSPIHNLGGMTIEHYHEEHDRMRISSLGAITLSENEFTGWIAFPEPTIPNSVIAPLYGSFDPGHESEEDIFYKYDYENSRIVIQWHTSVYPFPGENVHDFQMVIYPNESCYVFNYLHADEWVSEASIGFEDWTGTNFLQLDPAMVLHDSSSVKIGFMYTNEEVGNIVGRVLNSDGEPVSGAVIRSYDYEGNLAITDETGSFTTAEIQAGTWHLFAEDDSHWATEININVMPGETSDIGDITLTSPDGSVDVSGLTVTYNGEPFSHSFMMSSTGTGRLEYKTLFKLIDGDYTSDSTFEDEGIKKNTPIVRENVRDGVVPVAPVYPPECELNSSEKSEIILASQLDEEETGPWSRWENLSYELFDRELYYGIYGLAVTNDYIVMTEWGAQDNFGYRLLDHSGNLSFSGELPDELCGVLDLDSDGEYVYGIVNGNVYRWTPFGFMSPEVIHEGEWANGSSIAVDPLTGDIYICENYFFIRLEKDTNDQYTIVPLPDVQGLQGNISGIAYMPNEPDDMNLYVLGWNELVNRGSVIRINTGTGETSEPYVVYDNSHRPAGGICISNGIDPFNYTIATMSQNEAVDIWEGYSAQSWISISNPENSIPSGGYSFLSFDVDITNDLHWEFEPGQEYQVQVCFVGDRWEGTSFNVSIDIQSLSASEIDDLIPECHALYQNYPNPFNPSTEICFDLAKSQNVQLTVYNMLGQEVRRLIDGHRDAGRYKMNFDASNLASGVYFYRLETPGFTKVNKMLLIR